MITPVDPEKVTLRPRNVQWDWAGLPKYYVYGDPVTTHVMNTFNMLLPEGEIFFVELFRKALPLITDDGVREDVIGFIGQEALHAAAHQSLLEHCSAHGLPTERYLEQLRWLFGRQLGDRELTGEQAVAWLIERVAVVAALEHFTSYLGNFGLNATAWPGAVEPRVLDLVLWHLAEEVEHRHVAFDLFGHLDGRYRTRIRAYAIAMPMFLLLLVRGVRFLAHHDPDIDARPIPLWAAARRAWKRGMLPGPASMTRMILQYLKPGYHPRQYGSTTQAVAYLASSPAARAAG